MSIQIPKQRRGLKNVYESMSEDVRSFFKDLPALIDSDFDLDIALAYVFFRIEKGQRQTLYVGARKLYRTESELTWRAIDLHDLTRTGFKELFKTIYSFPISQKSDKCLVDAQKIRDDLMHGRTVKDKGKREAITKAMYYAEEMNDLIQGKKDFCP
ncbi:MAG: hypothetical protein F6J87_04260 [Spirulina sp. SIO3F2]|nr:hypothetical protein [Spirulina sp. SIO3F2]